MYVLAEKLRLLSKIIFGALLLLLSSACSLVSTPYSYDDPSSSSSSSSSPSTPGSISLLSTTPSNSSTPSFSITDTRIEAGDDIQLFRDATGTCTINTGVAVTASGITVSGIQATLPASAGSYLINYKIDKPDPGIDICVNKFATFVFDNQAPVINVADITNSLSGNASSYYRNSDLNFEVEYEDLSDVSIYIKDSCAGATYPEVSFKSSSSTASTIRKFYADTSNTDGVSRSYAVLFIDAASNSSCSSLSPGDTFVYDGTAPSVVVSGPATSPDYTGADFPISSRATAVYFKVDVTDDYFDTTNSVTLSLNYTGDAACSSSSIASVPNASGMIYTAEFSNCTGWGTVDIVPSASFVDFAGNAVTFSISPIDINESIPAPNFTFSLAQHTSGKNLFYNSGTSRWEGNDPNPTIVFSESSGSAFSHSYNVETKMESSVIYTGNVSSTSSDHSIVGLWSSSPAPSAFSNSSNYAFVGVMGFGASSSSSSINYYFDGAAPAVNSFGFTETFPYYLNSSATTVFLASSSNVSLNASFAEIVKTATFEISSNGSIQSQSSSNVSSFQTQISLSPGDLLQVRLTSVEDEIGNSSSFTTQYQHSVRYVPGVGGIYAGATHACALSVNGSSPNSYCWGSNSDFQLGDNSNSFEVSPIQTSATIAFTSMALGSNFSCATEYLTGHVYCWGSNSDGKLSQALAVSSSHTPTQIQDYDRFSSTSSTISASSLAAGENHACALSNGKVFCWGDNFNGQLGNDTKTDSMDPVLIASAAESFQSTPGSLSGVTFSELKANGNRTCGQSTSQELFCWGENAAKNGTVPASPDIPIRVVDAGLETFAVGSAHICTTTDLDPGAGTDYKLRCWGTNTNHAVHGQTSGTTLSYVEPGLDLTPPSLELPFVDMDAGDNHTCAIGSSTRQVYCWGLNGSGQSGGSNTSIPVSTPTLVPHQGNMRFTSLSLGSDFSCALSESGHSFCWGNNTSGQLGIGTTSSNYFIQLVELLFSADGSIFNTTAN